MKLNKAAVVGGLLGIIGAVIGMAGDYFTEKGDREETYKDLERRYGLKPVEEEAKDGEKD